jgi:hypothetical protein
MELVPRMVVEFAQTEGNITLDNRPLADILLVTARRVHEIRYKAQTTRKPLHRPPSLTLDEEEVIHAFILSEDSGSKFVTQKEFLRFLEQNFNTTLTYGWRGGFLEWQASQLTRMQVPRSHLNQYVTLIQVNVPVPPAELIVNMDETIQSDWEEWTPKSALVLPDVGDVYCP